MPPEKNSQGNPTKAFAAATVNVARLFVQALVSDEDFTRELRESLLEKSHTYLSMDQSMAKVLYGILKLQQLFLQNKGDEVKNVPQADRRHIAAATGLNSDGIRPILNQLRDARYVVLGNLRRVNATEGKSGDGHEIYEIHVPVVVSCADTAAFLVELLEEAQKIVRGTPQPTEAPWPEIDGKVNRKEFVDRLCKANKFKYFKDIDLLGDVGIIGKIDQVTDAGEYIERVSATHIRPRMRIMLERPYLMLVALQIPLTDLPDYIWLRGQWHKGPKKTLET